MWVMTVPSWVPGQETKPTPMPLLLTLLLAIRDAQRWHLAAADQEPQAPAAAAITGYRPWPPSLCCAAAGTRLG